MNVDNSSNCSACVQFYNLEKGCECGGSTENTKNMNYAKVNRQVNKLINQGMVNPNIVIAKEPIPVKIADVNAHVTTHERGVTLEEAQSFVDNAVVMFDQRNRSLYVSRDGNAVIIDANKRLVSAYRREDFSPGIRAILEVIDNGQQL